MADPKPIIEHLSVTVQPSKADIRRFAHEGYRTLINNRPDGEEPGGGRGGIVEEAAAAGYDLNSLPALSARLKAAA